jgi:hypothetical protein
MTDLRALADERLLAARTATGAPDPRELHRDRLRKLKEINRPAYESAVRYFEKTLIPEIAVRGADPLDAWLEYGRYLASLFAEGQTVQIDRTGRSYLFRLPIPNDHLVLHIPTSVREPALAVRLPREMSEAQQTTYDLLVLRKIG